MTKDCAPIQRPRVRDDDGRGEGTRRASLEGGDRGRGKHLDEWWNSKERLGAGRVCVASSEQRAMCKRVLDSITVSIPACHAGDPGSIPGRGASLFILPLPAFSFLPSLSCCWCPRSRALVLACLLLCACASSCGRCLSLGLGQCRVVSLAKEAK